MAKAKGKQVTDILVGARFLQVDPGTFSGRQPLIGNWYPVVWVHRNPDSLDEIWILYRPGSPEGFWRVGTSSQAARLDLDWLGGGNEYTPAEFQNWVLGEYVRLGLEPSVGDLEVYEYRADGPGNAPYRHGLFQTGAYEVRQVNRPRDPGEVIAWVFRIAAGTPREVWLLRDGYYVNPGPANASANFIFTAIGGIATDEEFVSYVLGKVKGPADLLAHVGYIYHQ